MCQRFIMKDELPTANIIH